MTVNLRSNEITSKTAAQFIFGHAAVKSRTVDGKSQMQAYKSGTSSRRERERTETRKDQSKSTSEVKELNHSCKENTANDVIN